MTVENILHYISRDIDAKLHLEELHKDEIAEILSPYLIKSLENPKMSIHTISITTSKASKPTKKDSWC